MKKINVLLLIDSLGIGGAEYIVKELALGLKKTKYYNPVVCCLIDGGPFAEELKKNNIKVIELNKEAKFDFKLFSKLINCIKENDIHIIHSHLLCSNFYGRIVAFLIHKPIIITEHGLYSKFKTILINLILSHFVYKIVCVSNGVKTSLIKQGINKKKLIVIYNGINLHLFKHNKQNFKTKNLNLGFVGRLVPEKNIFSLLDLMPRIINEFKNVNLLIVGDGILRKKIQNYIDNLNLSSHIKIAGYKQNKEVVKLLKKIDLLILPSDKEGLPISVLEAMASGLPVVATDVGGVSDAVVNNKTGLLVQKNSKNALFNAISVLLKDQDLRRKMGLEGKRRVKKYFNIQRMIKEYVSLYNTLDLKEVQN